MAATKKIPDLMTVFEASKELDRSTERVRQMVREGILPAVHTIGGRILLLADDVRRHVSRRAA